MSFVKMAVSDTPNQLFNEEFGAIISPEDRFTDIDTSVANEPTISWEKFANAAHQLEYKIAPNTNNYEIHLDVHHFSPDEISVKFIDEFIVVEAKQERKKDDHGYITRHFIRKFEFPATSITGGSIDITDRLHATISSDGVLTIIIAKYSIHDRYSGIWVPIEGTGPFRKYPKESTTAYENEADTKNEI